MSDVRKCNEKCDYFLRFPDSSGECFYLMERRKVHPEGTCVHELLTEEAYEKMLTPLDKLFHDTFKPKNYEPCE